MSLQGLFAIVAGFIAMAAIVMAGSAVAAKGLGIDPAAGSPERLGKGYLAFDYTLGLVAAVAGGALTAWLAPFSPSTHAAGLSAAVLAMAVVCLFSYGDKGPPRWYQAALSVSSALVVLLGARLAQSYF